MSTSIRLRTSLPAAQGAASAKGALRMADFFIDGVTMTTPPNSNPPRPPLPHSGASYDLSNAVPVNPHEDYREGDEFLFPDLARGCRIAEVYADGTYACDLFQLPHRNLTVGYEEYTAEDMFDMALLYVAGHSLPSSGRAN